MCFKLCKWADVVVFQAANIGVTLSHSLSVENDLPLTCMPGGRSIGGEVTL